MSVSIALTSGHSAAVDFLRSDRVSVITQVATIVLFAALTTLGAQVRIFLWEVPITLQTLSIYGGGLFLGARNGTIAALFYLGLGLFFPVYAGDGYGLAYLLTVPSAGYLFGMPFAAMITGLLSRRWNSLPGSFLSLAGGSLLLFTCGVLWLHFAADHATWMESIDKGFLRFAVFDATKLLCVALSYQLIRRIW